MYISSKLRPRVPFISRVPYVFAIQQKTGWLGFLDVCYKALFAPIQPWGVPQGRMLPFCARPFLSSNTWVRTASAYFWCFSRCKPYATRALPAGLLARIAPAYFLKFSVDLASFSLIAASRWPLIKSIYLSVLSFLFPSLARSRVALNRHRCTSPLIISISPHFSIYRFLGVGFAWWLIRSSCRPISAKSTQTTLPLAKWTTKLNRTQSTVAAPRFNFVVVKWGRSLFNMLF